MYCNRALNLNIIMSQWKWLFCCLIYLGIGATGVHSLSCGQCVEGTLGLSCPSVFDTQYTVRLSDIRGKSQNHFYLKCRHDSQTINLSYISDCDFSNVEAVELHWCPLPNVSFSDMFNQIGIVPENVLQLAFINVGQRQEVLQERVLEGLTNLETLELRDNAYTSIPPHIFDNTPNLEKLIFVFNNLETLPESLFWRTQNLTSLELHKNGLVYLPDDLFANLTNLKNVSLWENDINRWQSELLSNVPNLWSLELTNNNIESLDPDVFTGLKEIRKIILRYNNIEDLHETMFHNSPFLENLEFNGNRISILPKEIFRNLTRIRRLDFSNNRIKEIPENFFSNMKDLENLKFKRNGIAVLHPQLFEGLVNLQVLDLQSNMINALPPGIFDDLFNVDTLVLQNNSLYELPDEIFRNCESLIKLYLGNNHLSTLVDTMFPNVSTLTHLDLGNNNISFSSNLSLDDDSSHVTIQAYFPLSHLKGLTKLILKNNNITQMPQALNSELINLASLDMNGNSITYLDHNDLTFKTNQQLEIDFRNNKIKVIDLNKMNFSTSRKRIEIYVEGNSLTCDCKLYSFARIVQGIISPASGIDVVDGSNVQCTQPIEPHYKSYVAMLDTEVLTCKLQDCPKNCTCSTRTHDKMFLVDCTYRGLQNIPLLKKEQVPNDEDYSVTLALKNNSIRTLRGLRDEGYQQLVNLSIPYNRLNYINESYLPETLKVLDIQGNNMSSLPVSLIQFLNSTDIELSLGYNPWLCDCDIAELHKFLRDPDRQIPDIHNVRCSTFDDQALIELTEEDLCPLIEQPFVIATISCAAGFLLFISILGTVSFYKYQHDIKVWLFTHRLCLWAVAKEEKDADKKYDAFISYSDKDEDFVNRVLVPGLESGDPCYKVCIHYRDWVAGEYIQNQIDHSVEASRRTIVVLSSNFIENVWGQIEFKTAHSKALKDRTNRIIVIVLGEVPPDNEMDEELKLYLSTRTYLMWKDDKFWDKLRYAMPHRPHLHVKQKQKDIEKLELSKPRGNPQGA